MHKTVSQRRYYFGHMAISLTSTLLWRFSIWFFELGQQICVHLWGFVHWGIVMLEQDLPFQEEKQSHNITNGNIFFSL